MKIFHFHKLKNLFQCFRCHTQPFWRTTYDNFTFLMFKKTLTQKKLIRLNNLFIDLWNEINKIHQITPSAIFIVYYYKFFSTVIIKKKNSNTEEMFLFKVSFISLIRILSRISSLKLHVLLARIGKTSGQTTVIQRGIWSCTAEVWELFLTHFFGSGETQYLPRFAFYNVYWFYQSSLQLLHVKLYTDKNVNVI